MTCQILNDDIQSLAALNGARIIKRQNHRPQNARIATNRNFFIVLARTVATITGAQL